MSVLEGGDLMEELMHSEGILGTFFSILWYKGVGKRMHQLTGINIPDTILYLYSKPLHWYFSSKNGEIKKKARSRLNSKHIEEQFLKNGSSVSGIKACYLMAVPTTNKGEGHAKVKYTFGHELRKFLQEDKPNGVLQLFFDPKPEVAREGTATRNSMVQTTWSPGCFFIEKRVNKCRLDQHKIPIEERAATFDNYQNTETVPLVSASVAGQFQKVCQLIADHIRIVFRFKLASLVLNFKIDKNDTIWLLYCSSMRIVSEEAPIKSLTATTSPPLQYYQREMREKHKAAEVRRSTKQTKQTHVDDELRKATELQRCPLCTDFHRGMDMCSVPVQTVLTSLSAYDDETHEVPPPLLLLYPSLTPEDYQALLADPGFPTRVVTLCSTCVHSLVCCASSIQVTRQTRVPRLHKVLEESRAKSLPGARPATQQSACAEFSATESDEAAVKTRSSLSSSCMAVAHRDARLALPALASPDTTLEFYAYDRKGKATKLGIASVDPDNDPALSSLSAGAVRSLLCPAHYSLTQSQEYLTQRLKGGGDAPAAPARTQDIDPCVSPRVGGIQLGK